MRSLVVTATFIASSAFAADYEENRDLILDANGIDVLQIDAGAGSLTVVGESGRNDISVSAKIIVPDSNEERGRQKIEDDMVLNLQKSDEAAILISHFENGTRNFGDSPSIHLTVHAPARLALNVDDGSGSVTIEEVRGDIVVDDGSGSITMTNVGGAIEIEDGSGSVKISGAGGDVSIDDGSGSISVSDVAGSVVVDDGSGGIDVTNVAQDFIILDDGSGGVDYENVAGRFENHDI